MELVGLIPTTLLGLTVKAASAMPFSSPTVANTTVSNVPGPPNRSTSGAHGLFASPASGR